MSRCFCDSFRLPSSEGSYRAGFFVMAAMVAAWPMVSFAAVVLK